MYTCVVLRRESKPNQNHLCKPWCHHRYTGLCGNSTMKPQESQTESENLRSARQNMGCGQKLDPQAPNIPHEAPISAISLGSFCFFECLSNAPSRHTTHRHTDMSTYDQFKPQTAKLHERHPNGPSGPTRPAMGARGERAIDAGNALDERRFTPPNIYQTSRHGRARAQQSTAPELH